MFDRLIAAQDAVRVLEMETKDDLEMAVKSGALRLGGTGRKSRGFRLADLAMFRLAKVIEGLGVDPQKACRYAEAVLGSRIEAHEPNLVDWVENETQELFCLISDNQLARIFLRGRDDGREVDVGAVKPILFPTTMCEINVFRVIRPVVIRARNLLGTD